MSMQKEDYARSNGFRVELRQSFVYPYNELGFYGKGEVVFTEKGLVITGKRSWPILKKFYWWLGFYAASFFVTNIGLLWLPLIIFFGNYRDEHTLAYKEVGQLKSNGEKVRFKAPSDRSKRLEWVVLRFATTDTAEAFTRRLVGEI